MRRLWLMVTILVSALPFPAIAQNQLLPEINIYYKFNPDVRVYFQAKETREGGEPTTAEIGPSLDFHLRELSKLRDIAGLDLDKSNSYLLSFSIGYRYLPTPDEPPTNRLEPLSLFSFRRRTGSCSPTETTRTSTGRAEIFPGIIVIASKLNDLGEFAAIACPRMPAPSSGTRANTKSGAQRQSSSAAFFRSANMSVSTRITSTKTTPVRVPISN